MPVGPTSYYNHPPGQTQNQPYGGYEKATMYQTHYAPPAPAPVPFQAPAPVQQEPEKKPSKFSGLGNTMATSAAGGVGFGAGKFLSAFGVVRAC